MAAFLEQLAEALLTEHGTDLVEVAVVLPSQRAGLYLRHALAARAGHPLWSPEVFTLSSFMEQVSGLRTLSMEELLFEAYEAYRSVAGGEARSFEDFIAWAPVTLADISEADAHAVALQGFYRDLRSWEDLEWSFNTTPLSDGQQRMVRYWALTGKLHVALNERLLAAGTGTSGLIERTAADRTGTAFPWKRIWFAGLSALTPAQQRVIDRARDEGLARFAWDGDRYFVDAERQEAGEHLRAAIRRYGAGALPIPEHLATADLRVRVIRAPNIIAQAWCAAELVRTLDASERGRTVVVLADETLLPALVEALPGSIGPVNITMGLSLGQLPIGSLLASYFQLLLTVHGDGTWRFANVEALLLHPCLRSGNSRVAIDALIAALRADGLSGVPFARLQVAWAGWDPRMRSRAERVFAADPTDQRTGVLALLAWAREAAVGDAFATEQIYQASIALRRIHHLWSEYGHGKDPGSWPAVVMRALRTARIGFFGEPVSGLQIMGMLEMRGLDHHRVIVVGAQEGKLPVPSGDRSYIPFELRRAYGLPLRDSTDAVQAYNFLRMLRGAEEVIMVYADDGAANGPSRYIAQLEHELLHDRPERMVRYDARIPVPLRAGGVISVPSTERMREAIRTRLAKGLSPTMLRAWLKCPLDFLFRYVHGFKEPEEPGARIPSNVLGDALHAVVEEIYRPWSDRPLVREDLLSAVAGIPSALRDRLHTHMPAATLDSGQPLLQVDMATRAAQAFLSAEAMTVAQGRSIIPIGLEREVVLPLMGVQARMGRPVNVRGRLDRIDVRDGLVHVLDLKTGRVDEKALRIKEISLDELRGDKGYAAQLLVYAWLWFTAHPEVMTLRTGLLPMQRASASEGVFLRIDGDDLIPRSALSAITVLLEDAVMAMLDENTSFQHDPKSPYCVFCAQDN